MVGMMGVGTRAMMNASKTPVEQSQRVETGGYRDGGGTWTLGARTGHHDRLCGLGVRDRNKRRKCVVVSGRLLRWVSIDINGQVWESMFHVAVDMT